MTHQVTNEDEMTVFQADWQLTNAVWIGKMLVLRCNIQNHLMHTIYFKYFSSFFE